MIIAVSTQERKAAKRKLKKQMEDYRITIQAVTDRLKEEGTPFHYNTVHNYLNPETKAWNQDAINLVEKMIEEKKKPVTA